jgi:hypothetical protein
VLSPEQGKGQLVPARLKSFSGSHTISAGAIMRIVSVLLLALATSAFAQNFPLNAQPVDNGTLILPLSQVGDGQTHDFWSSKNPSSADDFAPARRLRMRDTDEADVACLTLHTFLLRREPGSDATRVSHESTCTAASKFRTNLVLQKNDPGSGE